jgi:hypothetical protein
MARPSPLGPAPRTPLRAPRRTGALAAAVAGATLLLATGCGGGSGSGSTVTAPGTTVTTTAPGTTVTTTIPPTGNRIIDAYLRDVTRAAVALSDFSQVLAEAGIGTGLRARQGELRAALARFDTALQSVARRDLPPVPQIEEQRDRITRTGRRLSSSLVTFVEAAAAGRGSTVQALLPDVTARIDDFQTATAG